MGNCKKKRRKVISFLKDTTRFGLNGVGRMLAVIFLFSSMNLIFFVLDIFTAIAYAGFWGWLVLLLGMIGGIAATVFAVYLTYKYLKFAVLNYIFVNTAWVIKSVCSSIIDEMSQTETVQAITNNKQVAKLYLTGTQLKENYYKTVPSYMHRGLLFILAFIPFMDIFFSMKGTLSSKGKKEGGEMLFQQVSFYFTRSVVKRYSKYTVYLLFGVNLLIQFAFYFLIRTL